MIKQFTKHFYAGNTCENPDKSGRQNIGPDERINTFMEKWADDPNNAGHLEIAGVFPYDHQYIGETGKHILVVFNHMPMTAAELRCFESMRDGK